jgi:pilus assembly protein Flp/PilA
MYGYIQKTVDYLRRLGVAQQEFHGLRREVGQVGQGMVEYALILVLIALVVIVIVSLMGKQVNNVFSNIANGLNH